MTAQKESDLKELILDYLKQAKLMHLATVSNGKPWVSNVWFAADNEMNIYWFSATTRRHSLELTKDNHVAAGICLPQAPSDDPRGLQVEGTAEILTRPADIAKASALFVGRIFTLKQIKQFSNLIEYPHRFYQIKPTSIVLYDAVNFPDESRREYVL
jgi:uncharacterized protein YhbP (UPF0306 family)